MNLPTAMKHYSLLPLLKVFAAALLLVFTSGAAMALPEINVQYSAANRADNGPRITIGTATVGTPTNFTFTIQNTTAATVPVVPADTLTTLSIAAVTGDYTAGSVASSVIAGGSTTFTITCTPTAAGNVDGTFEIISDDADENPYNISVRVTGLAPEIAMGTTTNSTDITTGEVINLGSIPLVPASTIAENFFISNRGNTGSILTNTVSIVPALTGPSDIGNFTITTVASDSITKTAGLSEDDFVVTFTPNAARTFNVRIRIVNNDADEDPFYIDISATATAPNIAVTVPVAVPVGPTPLQAAAFPATVSGQVRNLIFTITNSGNSNLVLQDISLVSGSDSQFSIRSQVSPKTVAPGGTASFTLRISPTAVANYTGSVSIPTNVTGKNPYVIPLTGSGTARVVNEDNFGYTMETSAAAGDATFLKVTDPDVFIPTGLEADDVALFTDIGFTFKFYEKSYSKCYISSNGLISFDQGITEWAAPTTQLQDTYPSNYIAAFWTDLRALAGPTGGKIIYATRGTAPNRRFIVSWDNMPLFYDNTKRITFQLTLFENINSVEVQYKSIAPSFGAAGIPQTYTPATTALMGIESANYNGSTLLVPEPTTGVDGLVAGYGDVDTSNLSIDTSKAMKAFPYGIRYTRPVVYTVESKYSQPTALDPLITTPQDTPSLTGVDLSIFPLKGTTYRTAIGTNQRFQAPEFIYLNRSFAKLPSVGTLTDSNPDNIAWYRLVNDGYAIDGQVVQGTHTFFSTTLDHDVAVIWRWRLEHAVIIESATGSGGFGNPAPEVGRRWYQSGEQFIASIDSNINDGAGGFRYNTRGYALTNKSGTSLTSGTFTSDAALRRSTNPITITQPGKLTWAFDGQVRYRFDAIDYANAGAILDGQSFIKVDNNPPIYGLGANTEVWINSGVSGSKVVVGAFYRSDNDTLTMGEFIPAPGGDIGGYGSSIDHLIDQNYVDQQSATRIARTFTVARANNPTDIHWVFQPTVYRAEVELGKSLDASSKAAANIQLTPDLPTNATADLKITEAGPGNTITTKTPPPDGSIMGQSDPLRWDRVGKALFPVKPGVYQIAWADANNSAKSYKVEILTGYPNQVVRRPVPEEKPTGARKRQVELLNCATVIATNNVTCASTTDLVVNMKISGVGGHIAPGTIITSIPNSTTFVLSSPAVASGTSLTLDAGDYNYDITLPPINVQAGYPAQPYNAHYRHLYDAVPARQAPTKLDLSAADEWKFQDLTFADGPTAATATKEAPGVPFTATGEGRSVLLYSYRPNSDEIADGNLDKERLAVRIVDSKPVSVITRNDAQLVLGRKSLILGTNSSSAGAYGVVQTGGAPASTSVDPGNKFVVDFWLNAKGLKAPAAVNLSDCTTTSGGSTVTCASTSAVMAGMNISGSNIPAGTKITSVTDGANLVISSPATANGSGLSLIANNKPVTVMTTGGGNLKVTLDEAASTATATYRGLSVSHNLPKTGVAWHHYAIHAFTNTFFNIQVVILDFYLDGVRQEQGVVSSLLLPTVATTVGAGLSDASLRFGVDAEALSDLQLDNFRLFNLGAENASGYLSAGDLRKLRTVREIGTSLRNVSPLLSFNFESAPVSGRFSNQGSILNVGVGTIPGPAPYVGIWGNTDLQEVATRIGCTLDNARFGGSGYVLNAASNFNANLYNRNAEIGTWGLLFPVNHSQLFTEAARKLEVAYYENPYLTDRVANPNVAWPYIATAFNEVVYPTLGTNKDKAIYIASRIGSEGVDKNGYAQKVFDLSEYSDLQIYNQPDKTLAGYNPNEEHAITAPSGRAALKVKNIGDDIPNNPPLAAFALQQDLNSKISTASGYSSDPWVLVQMNNLVTGEPEMAAYQVSKTRTGSVAFPRPTAAVVNAPNSGMIYESASNPEDAFLGLDVTKPINFSYQFEYPVMAGDLLIPPYPLNLVIGNVAMLDARGNSLQATNGSNQRTLWRDVNKNAWVVSGNGSFFHQYFYPSRGDFHMPAVLPGTPVAWLPDNGVGFTGTGTSLNPVKVVYNTSWRSDYPKLKRGETLTYQGGEYFSETPGAKGLPALVAMAAAEVIYDSSTPSMVLGAAGTDRYPVSAASARIMRPLDRRENLFSVSQMGTSGFNPANGSVIIVAERWYFKQLPGSLQKRFYFDSLAEKLVFRGLLNEKESGDADLTVGPDPLNILEPNVMTLGDYDRIKALSSNSAWLAAIEQIYLKAQNPHGVTGGNTSAASPVNNLQGVKDKPSAYPAELSTFWQKIGNSITERTSLPPTIVPLDSFGVGSALVPNPGLLTMAPTGSLYITIAENNRSELDGAPVSLHIVEIIPDRYRGAIKVIEGSDAFSEKITLQHNGEFGANTGDLYYEWWIRDSGPLDVVADEVLANGTLSETDSNGNSLWQEYLPVDRASLTDINAKHLGLHSIVFEGRPDVVLADKLVLMRYRHKDEANWKLVPFEFADANVAWKPGNVTPVTAAPFQWAGAANSPQLQADGSKRYVPQLVMGWVKRVLDRINPYEARYTDFFSNESPATYSSQIQIAGGPYAGKVALNPNKNVIENTGLIELYRTVLDRAKELSIDNSSNGNATDGIKQALLLAATRLTVLYELLGNEAYSDAQDTTISAGEDSALAGVASYTHAFQNMEADLQHEELALLRGTDFLKSYPVYNRMFWNYAKGLGEAAYNVNYNIYDVNTDGFINEDDARKLYPQGHGDSWGHFVSALDMHYTLLQHPGFSWKTRSELYSLMQNVLEVDFLDEKTFARLASSRARAGRDIVRESYRLAYTQDPDGQWQGYTDSADPARAWGVSEWAHRAGQGAFFDWAVANALVPENADAATPIDNPENLDRIDRLGAADQISEVSGALHEIQLALDEANSGGNPLGFDGDALAFDIDPAAYGDGSSHFEQIRDRASAACNNALTTLDFATQSQNKLRSLADDTDGLIQEAMSQDLDFRNRLIEIFGRPYDGTIGFGKAYPEGYQGPDTLLFAYLDKTRIDQIVPPVTGADTSVVTYRKLFDKAKGSEIMNHPDMIELYSNTGQDDRTLAFKTLMNASSVYRFGTELSDLSVPYKTASRYGFQAPTDWGQRTSYGRLQGSLQSMLAAEVDLDSAMSEYIAFLKDVESKLHRLQSEVELYDEKEGIKDNITGVRAGFTTAFVAANIAVNALTAIGRTTEAVAETVSEAIPENPIVVAGLAVGATIPTSPIVAAAGAVAKTSKVLTEIGRDLALSALEVLNLVRDEVIARLDRDIEQLDQIRELEGMILELQNIEFTERPLRNAIGAATLSLETARQEYFTAQSEGFRLLRERESFNKMLASKVQKNRYQDMIFRLSRNEAMSKYQSAYNIAARYTWMATKAYDYETSLDPGHPAAPGALLDRIVKERQLGAWSDGEPSMAHGGLAAILAQLNGNFDVLKSQLGINNPQEANEKISMRGEMFRIHSLDPELEAAMELKENIVALGIPEADLSLDERVLLAELNKPENIAAVDQAPASNDRWKDVLKARIVPDLNKMPEFVRYCRPFASGEQPGIVIRFRSCIELGKNFFGQPLAAGDHNYSTANFATKIKGLGVWMDNYNDAGLSISPRAYLVPIGQDYLRTSTSELPVVRMWNVVEQRIPAPFILSPNTVTSPGYIPRLDGVGGVFGDIRRHGDFRMYHNNGDPAADGSELIMDSRLISRSVWNSEWMLVIPGGGLHADPLTGLTNLADNITDIKLYFLTTSHQGQ